MKKRMWIAVTVLILCFAAAARAEDSAAGTWDLAATVRDGVRESAENLDFTIVLELNPDYTCVAINNGEPMDSTWSEDGDRVIIDETIEGVLKNGELFCDLDSYTLVFARRGAETEGAETYSFWEDDAGRGQKGRALFSVEAYNNRDECIGKANGFLACRESLFVTSLSVTDGAAWLQARHADGQTYRLSLLKAVDREHDLAVFSFPAEGRYPALEPEEAEDLQADQPVILMMISEDDVTVHEQGTITGFPEREEFSGAACIQFTDTGAHSIAGGCLFDDSGRLIGFATNLSGDEPYTAVAVPAKYVAQLAENLSPDGSEIPAAGEAERTDEDAQIATELAGDWEIADISISGQDGEDMASNLTYLRDAGADVTVNFGDGQMMIVAEIMGTKVTQAIEIEIKGGQLLLNDGSVGDLLLLGDTLILLDGENSITLVRTWTGRPAGDSGGEAAEAPEEETNPRYAYVSANSVNVREAPDDGAAKVMNLTKYAYVTVLDTVESDGKEWVYISFGDREGYMRSVFVTLLSEEENEAFLQSDEYRQGLEANP